MNLVHALNKHRFFVLLILLGLFFRIYFINIPGFKFDMDTWFAWALRLNQVGFSQFYSEQTWTNYTPGFLYILGFLGYVKNLLHIPDSIFYLLIKTPSIIAEMLLAIFIYHNFFKDSLKWKTIASAFVLFNPAFIFNSAIWGQIEGILSLAFVGSVYFLHQQKLILSSILLGIGFLIKPQTVALFPIFLLIVFQKKAIKNIFKITIPFVLTVILFSVPFFTNEPILGFLQLFSKMVSDYPYTSLFAYNLWGIVGFWINDNQTWNQVTYQVWGYILFGFYWVALTYLYLKKKLSLYTLSSLATLGFFFLPTRAHERYLYPAIVFLIINAALYKAKLQLVLTSILSLLHFINLYFVYVYYNEVYLKLPKLLYNPLIYNFIDSNSKHLSLVSTVIFILITIGIIKQNEISKKY